VIVSGSRSGAELGALFEAGQPLSWNFVRSYHRLRLTLPESLGGRTSMLGFEGSYTFTPLARRRTGDARAVMAGAP
jgi:hypothetical protein